MIDLVFVGGVLLMGAVGFFSGLVRQLIRLVALVVAWLVARAVGGLLAPMAVRALEVPPLLARGLVTTLVFLVLFALLGALGIVMAKRFKRGLDRPGAAATTSRYLDKGLGALLGAAKAFGILYLVLCMAVIAEGALADRAPDLVAQLRASHMAGMARNHNWLSGLDLPMIKSMDVLARMATDPQMRMRAAEDPAIQALARHPKIQALFGRADRGLEVDGVAGARSRSSMPSEDALLEVLEDPEIQRLIEQIDMDRLQERTSPKPAEQVPGRPHSTGDVIKFR